MLSSHWNSNYTAAPSASKCGTGLEGVGLGTERFSVELGLLMININRPA